LWSIGYVFFVKDPNSKIFDVLKIGVKKLPGVLVILSLLSALILLIPLLSLPLVFVNLNAFVIASFILILFAIFLDIKLLFSIPIYLVEGKSIVHSLKESWVRVKWPFVGKYFLLTLLIIIPLTLLYLLVSFVTYFFVMSLLNPYSTQEFSLDIIQLLYDTFMLPLIVIPYAVLLPIVYFKYLYKKEETSG